MLLTIAAVQAALVAGTALIKLQRDRGAARNESIRQRVTTQILQLLEDDGEFAIEIPAPGSSAGGVTRETLIALAGTVSGRARDLIVHLLENAGYVDRARAMLTDRNPGKRTYACALLGGMRSSRPVPELIERFVSDPDIAVRLGAAEALGDIGSVAALPVLMDGARAANQWQRIRLANVVAHIGEAAVPVLLEALQSADEHTVVFSLDVLAANGGLQDLTPLRPLLVHRSAEIRGRAAELAGMAGFVDAIDAIIDCAADPVWFVRLRAAKALEYLGVPDREGVRDRYYACLTVLLADDAWWVRQQAAITLAKGGRRGLDALTGSSSRAAATALQRRALLDLGVR